MYYSISIACSVTLSSPGGSNTKLSFSTLGYAKDVLAVSANDDLLWGRVNGRNGVAHWAFDVHEERVWRLDLSLKLVLGSFLLGVNVK